jgi:micrococcal nuclease
VSRPLVPGRGGAPREAGVPSPRPSRRRPEEGPGVGGREPRPGRVGGQAALVTRVVDGDTIEVLLGGRAVDVRLLGVDTPETVHPSEPVECYGPAASAFTSRALGGERVRLTYDEERVDPYGRALAYVWLDGDLFNRILVARGLATVTIYPPNDRYEGRLRGAQGAARSEGRGLWGACSRAPGGDRPAGDGGGRSACTPGYSKCLAPARDYDCSAGGGDGPRYAHGPIRVTGPDRYELDYDGDGIACE